MSAVHNAWTCERLGLVATLPQDARVSERHGYDATFGDQDLADRHVRAAAYTTLRLGLTPRGGRGATWYLNIQNLFDSPPPRLAAV